MKLPRHPLALAKLGFQRVAGPLEGLLGDLALDDPAQLQRNGRDELDQVPVLAPLLEDEEFDDGDRLAGGFHWDREAGLEPDAAGHPEPGEVRVLADVSDPDRPP